MNRLEDERTGWWTQQQIFPCGLQRVAQNVREKMFLFAQGKSKRRKKRRKMKRTRRKRRRKRRRRRRRRLLTLRRKMTGTGRQEEK